MTGREFDQILCYVSLCKIKKKNVFTNEKMLSFALTTYSNGVSQNTER